MIQRKQTLFLFFAIVAIVVCLFFPIATLESDSLGLGGRLFNLGVKDLNGNLEFVSWPLCLILTLSAIVDLVNIFLFNNRTLQIKLCIGSNILILVWYVYFISFTQGLIGDLKGEYHMAFASCLPLIAVILTVMPKKSIEADEALVKAADRIR